jgi:hypothetical protein
MFEGTVVSIDRRSPVLYKVRFQDGDQEDMMEGEIRPLLVWWPAEPAQKIQQGNPQTRSAAELDRLIVALRGADETDVCAICLEVYQDAHELVAFDCRHCFHVECVHQWLGVRLAAGVRPCCPLCRTSIKL